MLLASRVCASLEQAERHERIAAGHDEAGNAEQTRMLRDTDDALVWTRGAPLNAATLEPLRPRALHLHAVRFAPAPTPLPPQFDAAPRAVITPP